MMETFPPLIAKASRVIRSKANFYWKIVQVLFWLIGITMLLFMLFLPPIGVTLFWNMLIPVAPALLVVGTGFWRNVCPLATTALFPDRFGFSKKIKLTTHQLNIFNLIAIIALFVIIPLRHVVFNTDGQATAFLIIGVTTVAVASGFLFERKSGWCSGLCPVHPVEKLYGSGVAFTMPNLHCGSCVHCSRPCPDSTANITVKSTKSKASKISKYLLVGAFPGYVWGWFQVPDFTGARAIEKILLVYGSPMLGGIATLISYLVLKRLLGKDRDSELISFFAAVTVSCYYWFRLPQLIGFSPRDTNGVFFDLSNQLPYWTPLVLNVLSSSFFLWWIVLRRKSPMSWSKRPSKALMAN